MSRWPGIAHARWFGLIAAALAIAGTSIALASTDRHTAPGNPAVGYSMQ